MTDLFDTQSSVSDAKERFPFFVRCCMNETVSFFKRGISFFASSRTFSKKH